MRSNYYTGWRAVLFYRLDSASTQTDRTLEIFVNRQVKERDPLQLQPVWKLCISCSILISRRMFGCAYVFFSCNILLLYILYNNLEVVFFNGTVLIAI